MKETLVWFDRPQAASNEGDDQHWQAQSPQDRFGW
jgi:hypothetical protein